MIALLIVFLQAFSILNGEVLRSGIVKGTKAVARQFPYQISLRHNGAHTCGGAIVNLNTALTAAHCVADRNPTRYAIVAGITHLAERGIVHQVARIILSDEIKDHAIFDLAILKVAKPFVFNKLVAPIPLDMNGTGEGVTCIASGWGITRQNGSVSQDLLFTDVNTITNEECVKLQPYPSRRIYKSHLCTSTAEGKGVCQGDSGGPLACGGVLCGLTSWGWPCARGPPDCFFRISLFIEYIKFYMDQ